MALKLGTTDVSKVYVGSTVAQKVYLGTTEVWSNSLPVVFDAVAAGANSNLGAFTFTHTATAGSYVIVDVVIDRWDVGVSSVTYGGVAMTLLGQSYPANNVNTGQLYRFGLANAPGGAQTVSVNRGFTFGSWITATAISYRNVGSVGATVGAGAGNTLTQAGTITTPGQMLVQSFGQGNGGGGGATTLTKTGIGTVRFNVANIGSALMITESDVSGTFSATGGSSRCTLLTPLNPA
ncbi:minor tail protein [Mycobacterium phage DroogsArmy]|uniref:Minor tail protein n=1 Tax=Mycobacterium phage DroogsArmy TaxID=2744011 RepID=A0A6N0A3S7_9CAUD|nr:minor tail protein [Mycobacterium phage DroogsArmy]QKO02404.1 hypothetical protein SEA_DROOGSARMY_7 [Mycobacterium phage DroogsArmy]